MSLRSESVEHYNPEDALRGFSRTNFVNAVAIALVAHIVLIGGTSTTYIYREMILKRFDPEAYEAMLKEEAEEEQSATEAALGTTGEEEGTGEQNTESEEGTAAEGATAEDGEANGNTGKTTEGAANDDVPEHARDSSVVKQRSETAPPPAEPDDDGLNIGIDIDDTNL